MLRFTGVGFKGPGLRADYGLGKIQFEKKHCQHPACLIFENLKP